MTTAREYQRVSTVHDPRRPDKSPDEQHTDNARAADRHGWTLGDPYRDKVSASRYGRKVREDYGRLVDDLEHSRFRAEVLILWESSRGSRKVWEWARLIDLCEERKVRIYVTSDGRLYDCSDPRDRRSLQEDAVDAEYESAKTSRRIRRSAAAAATEGRPNGPAPYGYRRVYDLRTGRSVGQEIDPEEAPIVREIFRRIRSGEPITVIARDLNDREVPTRPRRRPGQGHDVEPSSAPWSAQNIRPLALNRAYLGERTHDPAGRTGRYSGAAVHYPATWPALVDLALWTAVRDRLTDPARKVTKPGRGRHWLSFIALCDVCSGVMSARPAWRQLGPIYICHARNCPGVRVPYDALNGWVEETLLAYLERGDIAHLLTAAPVDPEAVTAAEAEIARVEQQIDDLADRASAGGPAARRLLDRSLPSLEVALAAATAHRDDLTRPALLRGLIEPGREVRARWADTAMPVRREIARIIFTPGLVGELRIRPGRHTDPIDVRVHWRR